MQIVETVATELKPYDLYYLPWLEEVWVQAWSKSTFDVINVAGNLLKTHKAIKAHIKPGKLLDEWAKARPRSQITALESN